MKSEMTVGLSKMVLVCLLVAATVSCSGLAAELHVGGSFEPLYPVSDPEGTIERLVSARTNLVFRSSAGRPDDMDSFSDILLRAHHYAALTEHGSAVRVYHGNYGVESNGNIFLSLTGYVGRWPAMRLVTNSNAFYLQKAGDPTSFIMGDIRDRTGAVTETFKPPFWLFKLIETSPSDVRPR